MQTHPLHPLASSLLIPLSLSLLLKTLQSACPGDNGYCLPTYSLCNGVKDCSNGTDEDPSFCSSYNCSSAGLVRCQVVSLPSLARVVPPWMYACPSDARTPSHLICTVACSQASRPSVLPSQSPHTIGGGETSAEGLQNDVAGIVLTQRTSRGTAWLPVQSPDYARPPRRPVCMLSVVSHLLCSVSSAPVCDCCCRCCQMSCPSGTGCVQLDQLCNGKQDCADGSDESADFCGSFNCTSKGEVGAAKARRFEL